MEVHSDTLLSAPETGRLPLAAVPPARGWALLESGRVAEAERVFLGLARARPEVPAGHVGLAQVSMRRGAWAEALTQWDRLLATFPAMLQPAWLAARAGVLARLGRVAEARAACDALIRSFPDSPAGYVTLARLAGRQELWSDALERWDEILGRFDDPAQRPFWEATRAATLQRLGRLAEAETALRALVAARPGLYQPLLNLLSLLVATARPEEALDILARSKFRDLVAPLLFEMRCRILFALCRLDDARAVFTRTFDTASETALIDRLVAVVPRLYEGWRRTEWWLALRAKLAVVPYPDDPAAAAPIEFLRARLSLALRDRSGFLAAVDKIEPHHLGSGGAALYVVAAALREPEPLYWQKPKIFGIGLSKTGTTTLAAALTALGLATLDWHNPLTGELLSDDDLHLFTAFTDTPVCLAFEKYYHLFPNSKFIYTTRPLDAWLTSIDRHWERHYRLCGFAAVREAMRRPDALPYGTAFCDLHQALFFNHQNYAAAYQAHDRRVRRFFSDKPSERFLEFDVFAGQGWPELCRFIDCPIPGTPFPWRNRAPPYPLPGSGAAVREAAA